MDMNETPGWLVVFADRLDRLLAFWHAHRIVFVVGGVLLGLVLLWRLRGQEPPSTRAPSPATEEKTSWLDTTSAGNEKQNIFERTQNRPGLQRPSSNTNSKTKTTGPRVVSGRKPAQRTTSQQAKKQTIQPYVFYASLTGNTKATADSVLERLASLNGHNSDILKPELLDLAYIDLDDYFVSGPKAQADDVNIANFYLVLLPSYDIDSIITNFLEHLRETHHDFRIDTAPLSQLRGYSVFGLGDIEGWPSEEQGFCSQAIEVDKWLAKLTGRKRAYPIGLGDIKSNAKQAAEEWMTGITQTLQDILEQGSLGEGVAGSGAPIESDDEAEEEEVVDDLQDEFPDLGRKKRQKLNNSNTIDVEDMGGKSSRSKQNTPLAIDFTTYSSSGASVQPRKAMVPKESPTYTSLTKQGYTIVGTHSGVKICRWTKSALRGRGSCYKNSFYGIASHLCMETTPSLSCSNKCVFCWRHGTNPVSTTWRWEVDDPQLIFDGAKEGHYKKIKMMRGVPGVRAERFEEAMRIRHCALSLVGEPIFYPRINEFLGLLHGEQISSFLVCNAQHPQQLQDLDRVTQLYVSIDASNKESLRKIDRPLHRDFWERFNSCLDILREKRFVQRTVFRLTLVKGFNVEDEAEGYADLVAKGLPCFVEVKGVTYCGTTSAAGAGLTMQNVPFYEEVVEFVTALNAALERRGLGYGIAAEHAHSCCILLASNRFLIDGVWNTVINYEKFFNLLESGKDFGPEDYCAPTAEWAWFGNGGFDPRDERVDRKGRPKEEKKLIAI
ncbi:Fe-S oxidoreductase [Knufia obscura]|uniref:tRNA 4-demethylwyosine synthase (AdoMet-dependent) n=1 Tax=Knufia obscura TaxID=1635080 RepID=A0ABR0RFJ2_9EURO|nr:Fe-S oxidoreductase [Knufia obscura]